MAQTKKFDKLKNAYAYCEGVVKNNYENFPVASFFLPKTLRQPITVIYAFARTADNYADDANLSAAAKLTALQKLEEQVLNMQGNSNPTAADPPANDQLLLAMAAIIQHYQLPIKPFIDLLTAFKQDVTKTRYDDFGEILNYCCHSANPIGRLLLHLSKQDSIENLEYADYICTSLQLINFMQDLYADLTTLDRCYLPLNELNKFKVSIAMLKAKQNSPNITALLKYQLDRISSIYNKGVPLGSQLNGVFGFEIRLIIAGGRQILKALYSRANYYQRPVLTGRDKFQMFMLSLFANSVFSTTPIMADQ